MEYIKHMMEHAKSAHPYEACGLVVQNTGEPFLLLSKNMATNPRSEFQISEDAWLAVADGDTVVGIYHSHADESCEPSMTDRVMCEATDLPWHIVSYPQHGYTCIVPEGYKAPYLRRPYVHGVLDCYTIIKDWYEREWQLELPEFDREDLWWEKDQDLYQDNFGKLGFKELPPGTAAEIGDAFLIQLGTKRTQKVRPNHGAIYIGDGKILHHPRGRLSGEDVYGGMWEQFTVYHLRHESRMTHG